MAIFVSDKFDSYNFREWTKTFDSSASTSTQATTDDWTIYELSSSGGGGNQQFNVDPIFNRGGYGRTTRGGGYEVSVSRQTSADLTQYGRTYVSFTVSGSTPSGYRSSTRSGNAYGNVHLYLIDSTTGLTSGTDTNTLPSAASSNNQLIAEATGQAYQDVNGIGWFCGQVTLKIEDNQVTIYNNLVGFNQGYGGGSNSHTIVSDGTVVNTSTWSGELYLYLVYRAGDTNNYNSNKVHPTLVRSPLFLSNRPFGGSGGF